VVDADIYGHSVPRMLGVDGRPTRVEDMIMPPQSHGVKVHLDRHVHLGQRRVVWRGPMLHRALQQFLADVYWGDLDVLLLDLPPGTGDVAISLAQLLRRGDPRSSHAADGAAEVAERAGAIALQTHQRLIGVVENIWLECRTAAHGGFGRRRPDGADSLIDDGWVPRAAVGQIRWTPGCARPATPAPRSCWPTRTPRRRRPGRGGRQLACASRWSASPRPDGQRQARIAWSRPQRDRCGISGALARSEAALGRRVDVCGASTAVGTSWRA
jgi:hypothetical protein